jgi:DNA-binding transcriptional LysR family regulator
MLSGYIFTSSWLFLRYSDAIMQHINWDNLRYVLMVANRGSISAAARELGVNRSTVLRRINTFQENLNCRIFDRSDSGYVLTSEAEKMIDAAREVESTLLDMQRQIAGHELKLEGELRVTTTDTFMSSLLGPYLASFRRQHPHIVVDLLVTNNILDLNRRDADVAIRPTLHADARLVGRRLRDVDFGIYAGRELLSVADRENVFDGRWIGFVDDIMQSPIGAWFAAAVEADKICLRCDSFVSVRIAAEAGIGLALLPCLLGDASTELTRLPADTSELTTGLWALAHPDLVRSARVHAFIEHLSEALAVS